jgi:hypothetical protein
MWSKKIAILSVINIVLILLTVRVGGAQKIEQIWRWHEKGYEIYHATLSPDNRDITFDRKLHWPDGHEAEMFSERELKRYEDRKKQNNRFADPEVMILDIGKKKINKIEWGWAPEISPDGQRIVYAYQLKPISGFRILAATLAGNEIHEYNMTTNKISTLTKPDSGYLNNPFYSNDDEVIYSFCDAVNGAYGGAVGIGKVNTKTTVVDILYKPRHEFDLYHIIDSVRANNGNILFIRKRPAESGTFLANSYYYELIKIDKNEEASVIYEWGKQRLGDRIKVGYKIDPPGNIQIYNNGWKSVTKGRDNSRDLVDYGIASPNGEYVVLSNDRTITVKKFNDDQFNLTWKFKGDLQFVKWSSDSKKIILIVTNYKRSTELFDFDELVILEIKK